MLQCRCKRMYVFSRFQKRLVQKDDALKRMGTEMISFGHNLSDVTNSLFKIMLVLVPTGLLVGVDAVLIADTINVLHLHQKCVIYHNSNSLQHAKQQ
mmetsp:Transcript_7629/g.11757  ORF Transcript_7629/g.11757 Transcript_7629/m.11757 type:complete len:97 (+) Transcript_7629:206-496(+)